MAEAYDRELQVYGPLRVALHKYISSGWTVRVLPWIVGARGLIYEQSVQAALEFLEIPRKQWSSIVRSTVQESVEALAFMCKLRFSPSSQNRIFDTDDPRSNLVERTADRRFS